MAKYSEGINGPFTGKVGAVVGTTWMGMPVMRARPSHKRTRFSPLELQQQEKFRMMSGFLKPLISTLNLTFKPLAGERKTGFNKAFSYNVKNAIAGTHPGMTIDFTMVLLGRGDLPNESFPKAFSRQAGKLEFTWTDNSGKGKALGTDKAFVILYIEELKTWLDQPDIAPRSACACTLDTTLYNGKTAQTYLGFISEDQKEVSDTVYLGEVKLIEA